MSNHKTVEVNILNEHGLTYTPEDIHKLQVIKIFVLVYFQDGSRAKSTSIILDVYRNVKIQVTFKDHLESEWGLDRGDLAC